MDCLRLIYVFLKTGNYFKNQQIEDEQKPVEDFHWHRDFFVSFIVSSNNYFDTNVQKD